MCLGEGINEAMKQADEAHGARPELANKIMVIFTDGWNNKGPEPDEVAKKAQALGFDLYSVGVVVPLNSSGIPIKTLGEHTYGNPTKSTNVGIYFSGPKTCVHK